MVSVSYPHFFAFFPPSCHNTYYFILICLFFVFPHQSVSSMRSSCLRVLFIIIIFVSKAVTGNVE